MRVLVDTVCPNGHTQIDVWAERGGAMPFCVCGEQSSRLHRTAPAITPNGTRREINREVSKPRRVDTKAIAAETMKEVEQKMLRFSDPDIAETHISREFNAHIETPIPTPTPITFPSPVGA